MNRQTANPCIPQGVLEGAEQKMKRTVALDPTDRSLGNGIEPLHLDKVTHPAQLSRGFFF
jgi:hypothetical protein